MAKRSADQSCDGWVIEVVNWAKYNPRTDSKAPTWFRMENDIALGPGFHGLNCETKWIWVVILSLASKKNGAPVTWSAGFVESISGISEPMQRHALEIFEKFTRLRVTNRVTTEVAPLRDETNETNETRPAKKQPAPLPRLAEIWNLHCGPGFSKVVRCSSARRKIIQTRWGEAPQDDFWIDVVRKMTESPFLRGERPSEKFPDWKADFDWLIEPDNANKVFEGKYDDKKPAAPPAGPKFLDFDAIRAIGGIVANQT